MIACVLIPYFAAAAERRAMSAPAAMPLAIVEPPHAPMRVYAVSREAAQLGLKPGMSLRQAQVLCPQACLIPANLSLYQRLCDELVAILAGFTERLELEAIEPAFNIYLDLGYLKSADAIASGREIGRAVRTRAGLTPALGLASGKFPTWAAATATSSNKALVVGPGQEAVFLAPRSINLLPLDEELLRRFQRLGLRTLGQFAALPAGAVLVQFGSHGRWLHQLARGQDDRPVLPRRSPPIEQTMRQLDGPVCDWAALAALSRMMAAELANRLQASSRVARLLRLNLQLEDNTEWVDQIVLRQPTSNSERLALNVEALLRRLRASCGILAVTITVADLLPAMGQQLDLFGYGSGSEQVRRLNERLPDLIARYGAGCFYQAAVTNPAAYLPEGRFQLRAVAAI